ncbi:MAG: aminotransferase class V-fold PLP-dependent enzyme [Gammaproteobacteria bacterium]|nr:aminotransferase class V-fold PLP-dependent enzyme [Gammaproteobacteria bacterium]MBP9729343.1 aminotransferase class V-fold PLP-dependent enzyme [Gammaproteobacteria bacterium]
MRSSTQPPLKPVYLDYAATTPVDPRVVQKMQACLGLEGTFANPASDHALGSLAKALVEEARVQVAKLLHTVPRSIVFTSGATESINLALKGVAHAYQHRGKHIITAKTEHPAVLDSCAYLESIGYEVTYLDCLQSGLIALEDFKAACRSDTVLISVMHVNNETGVVQDIAAMAAIARDRGIIFHVDAAQSVGKIPIDVQHLKVDLLSFSGHKIYGPKGVGVLYVGDSPRIRLTPQIHGGGQERGLRAGTLATHQIVGLGEACRIAHESIESDYKVIAGLRDAFCQGIQTLAGVMANIPAENTVPHILNLRFEGLDSQSLIKGLAIDGLAFSQASACHATHLAPSYVLRAMGFSDQQAAASLRFSFGRFTTQDDIARAIKTLHTRIKGES